LVLTTVLRSAAAPSAAPTPAAAAPLIARGQILPARQARVGTQGGGVVQQLALSPGDQVPAQAPLAWVLGPTGTEIITAPFGGTITNVLVHAGDTLMPGATVAVVADLRTLQVETSDVDEFLINKIAPRQRVQIRVDALDNLALTGIVTSVALLPQISAAGSAAYPVIIKLNDVPREIRAGMSVRVIVPDPPGGPEGLE
jgi:multidrug resistance efflux pump